MFADWVIMGVVVTDVFFKAGAPNSYARIRLATSGPRGRFFVTAWAYGRTAETARDLLRSGCPAVLRGYFNPDTSQGARGDALSLIVSHVDVPKVSDYSDAPQTAPTLAVQQNDYEPGEAARVAEKLTETHQGARKVGSGGETSSEPARPATSPQDAPSGDAPICPLRKSPCKANCAVRETCEGVARAQGLTQQ